MTELHLWLDNIKTWYQKPVSPQQRDIQTLIDALNHAPDIIFSDVSCEAHNEALAYWLDACQRLSFYYQDLPDSEKAFNYMQFGYAKLQSMVCDQQIAPDLKRWCLKKLDRMIVAMMEFCQQQPDSKWQQESTQLIDLHVAFMESQNNLNLSYSESYY
ncbi:hypothetical protein A3K86_20950 [Photobacterium jeanii]|uniref:Transcriptional regulator n=1 Tax=Photobacterium jeanii TaxID=858640 RepID=A0A178K380_9GAMM|nr:hypothetical protein [Photobacterium jeanii]OAN11415.1 hypothetical protein A3K86_20950 [Photobacterium jeanii]PST90935.1 hypothetical protein C9I91_10055 [Photobacterium jeanii]